MNRISTNWKGSFIPFNKLLNVWSGEYGFFLHGKKDWLYYGDETGEKHKKEREIFLKLARGRSGQDRCHWLGRGRAGGALS